jgi:hypothetical protein
MKAAFIERFGGPEVFQYGDLPDPVASPGEVVIDIAATSVNAADWKVRLGEYKHTKFPLVPGRDFSGTVSAVGESVKDIALGDTVFGVCEAGREGTYAEKLAAKAGIVALVYRTPFIHSCLPLSDSTEEVRTTQMWVKRYPACKLLTTIRPRANPSVTIIAPYVDVEIFGHKGLPSDPYMSRRSDRLSEHSGRLTSVAPAGCQPTLLHKESPPERASRSTYSAARVRRQDGGRDRLRRGISRKIGRASTASMARSRCFCLGSVNHSPFNLRRRLAKIVQGPLAEQVRVALAGFRKLNDLTGDHCDDEIVSIRKSEGGACHLECDAHDPPGLGVEVLAV